ncbi:MAG: hypothetical protein HQK67_09700 [Desulfamplus sp.]|nr:hypothetical protein [Desulfamplus sp.]
MINDMVSRKIAFINLPLFSQAEMERQRGKSRELASLLEQKRATFKTLIIELEDMKTAGFPGTIEEIEGKIKDILAAANAVTPQYLARLKSVQRAWEERKRVIKDMEEKELSAIFEKIEYLFKNILFAATEDESNENEKMLRQIEELITQGMKLNSVSVAMKKSLNDFKTQMDSAREITSVRKSQFREMMNTESLDAYIRELKTFSGAFPDDPVTKKIVPIIDMAKIYSYFLSAPSIKPFDSSQESDNTAKSEQSNDQTDPNQMNDPENIFWFSTSEIIRTFNNNIRIHKNEVKEELAKMERTARFVDLWECTVNKPNFEPEKWYFNGKPSEEFVKGVKSYAGIVYILSPDDLQPDFKINNAITIQVQDLRKMQHCDVVQQMINNISYDIGMESIMQEIHNIYRQTFSPILKLHLISFLTEQLFVLVGKENALPFIEMSKDFKRFNNQVNWLCTASSKYTIESRQAQTILTHHLQRPDKMNEYIAQWKIRKTTMKRIPRWVGFADLKDPEQLHFKTGKRPNEIWVVRNGRSGKNMSGGGNVDSGKNVDGEALDKPMIFVTEIQDINTTVKYYDHKGYLPGEPLFAPYDNNTTDQVLRSILVDSNLNKETNIQWPSSWPVNIRHL